MEMAGLKRKLLRRRTSGLKKQKKSRKESRKERKDSVSLLKKMEKHVYNIKAKNSKQHPYKILGNRHSKIRVKLIGAFLVSVFLIIILGFISYENASKTITDNYEKSTKSTAEAMGMYVQLIMDDLASKVTEIANSTSLTTYYGKVDKLNTSDAMELYRDTKTMVVNMKASSDKIYSYHIFGQKGNAISSEGTLATTTYEDYLNSSEGKEWIENPSLKEKWSGNHEFIDDKTKISEDDYSLSLTKKFPKENGFIIVDMNKEVISEALKKMNLSENGIVSFITPNGREITLSKGTSKGSLFINQDFYKKSLTSEENSTSSYEMYHNQKYLYVYTKIGDTGTVLCSLIPESDILMQVSWIKFSTIIMVLLASLIAILIGTVIATGISKEVTNMTNSFAKISEGDFTTELKTHRKDEFMMLNLSIKNMLESIRSLIGHMMGFGSQVFSSSEKVSITAGTILISTKDISSAMEEVGKGIVLQASDAEKSLKEMSSFSNKINGICESTGNMEKLADGTILFVNNGKLIVGELNEKSSATSNITKTIIQEIEELEHQSNSIGSIIGAMNEIAEQTNLLSLNASIEAARAGENGRGFAVVAEEIRKLAEQSVNASNSIKKIIDTIQVKTKQTVASARQAEDFLESQSETLDSTITVFNDINMSVDDLVEGLKEIATNMEEIGSSKNEILDSIRNISSVSQEAAASSEEIVATINEQVDAVSYLVEEAKELTNEATNLEESMKQFVV